ncbi:MAG: tape measure protein [Christensenellaceae bacterium]
MADQLTGIISLQNKVTPVLEQIIVSLRDVGANSDAAREALRGLEDLDLSDPVAEQGSFNSELRRSEGLADKLKGKYKLMGAAATAAITGALKAGVEYNATIETYTASFSTMLGDAEKATALVNKLNKMGAATPFETSDLMEVTQLLMNYGLSADQAVEKMTMLGDIAQGNRDKMVSVATAYGQMSSAGKVSLEDIKQMIEAGFNPLQEITQTTGESMASLYERISKGAISVKEITDSMESATSEGGKYYKSMENQSKTFSGMVSSMKDNVSQLLGVASQGLFEGLKDTLAEINGYMGDGASADALKNAMEEVGKTVGSAFKYVKSAIGTLWEFRGAAAAVAGTLAGYTALKTVVDKIQKISNAVKQAKRNYQDFRIALDAVRGVRQLDATATAAQIAMQKKLSIAMKAAPWAALAAVIGGVIAAGIKANETMSEIRGTAASAGKAVDDLSESLKESSKRIAEAENDAAAACQDALSQVNMIDRAIKNGFSDATIKEMVAALEEAHPEMEGFFSLTKEGWKQSAESVDEYIAKIREAALAETYKEELGTQARALADAKQTRDKVAENLDSLKKNKEAEIANLASLPNYDRDEAEREVNARIANAEKKLAELNATVSAAETQLTETENKLSSALEASFGSIGEAYKSQMSELEASYSANAEAIKDASAMLKGFNPADKITDAMANELNGIFTKAGVDFSVSAGEAVSDILSNMEATQSAADADFLYGMATLSKEILDKFDDRLGDEEKKALKKYVDAQDKATKKNGEVNRKHVQDLAETLKKTKLKDVVAKLDTDTITVKAKLSIAQSTAANTALTVADLVTGGLASKTFSSTGRNATGTPYWKGGATVVNENGDEIIDLPRGSRIYTAEQSRKIIENKSSRVNVNIASLVVREEADIDKIAAKIVERIDRARLTMA